MAHAFPFIGAGVAAARKTMDVLVVFAAKVPASARKRIVKGLPMSLSHTTWGPDSVLVAHDADSLSWVVRAEFAAADPDYYGDTATNAQWVAFNAAFDRWLVAAHVIAPIAVVVRPIDEEYSTETSAWHDWSVQHKASIDRKRLPKWAVAELDAARVTPKAKPAKKPAKPPPKPSKSVAKLANEVWALSYQPEPLVAAMDYHRKRGETELEAAVFWGGVLYLRLFPNAVDRERSKAIGRPPADAHDRFARWLLPWLEPRFANLAKLSLNDVRDWLGWCCRIQSAVLDDWHALLEDEVIRRAHGKTKLVTTPAFCPICGKPMDVRYAGKTLLTARCTATNARMAMHAGDYLHRNMFESKPTGPAFNAMIAREPDWFCARCGSRHRSRKTKDGYTVQLQCPKCKHGYTSGLLDGVYKSMHDRHYRG